MTVVADGGYVSDEFRTALVDARATLEFTQAGEPTMRAVVERIFRTVAMGLMSRLKGRTFSNIFERGDYNSEGHAGLTPDELALILVTWVVDIYHNTPHEGLGGKTPNRAWDEAVEKYGVHPWRDAHGRRSAFGVRLKRKLTRGGFEVLGNLYQDEDPEGLRHHYFNSHNPEFEIALDVTNLGAISVLIDEKAIMVPCKDPKMEGVHAAEWVQTTEFLRRQNDLANQAGREIAHKALKRIQEINDRAGLRATIATPVYSAEQVIAFEDRHFKHFRYTEPPEGQKSEILGQRIGAIELEIDDLTHSALSPSALEEGAEAQPEAKLKAKPEDNSSAEKPAQPASDIRTSNDWTMEE